MSRIGGQELGTACQQLIGVRTMFFVSKNNHVTVLLTCIGKKRNKPVEGAEFPPGTYYFINTKRPQCNKHVLGSKKKSEGSVEPVSKEKKQVNFLVGH